MERVSQSIFLKPVTEEEIKRLSIKFKTGKASGSDGVNIADIKSNIEILAKPLSHVINLSISTSIVPNNIKLARVIPINKSDCRSEFSNYRPISILPVFSKFFEKVIYDRLIFFY